jgi:beta-glucuronidase
MATLRNFPQHEIRPTETLSGRWDFVTADERTDRAKLPRRYTRSIHVPSAWEQLPGLENYRGKAWLRTTIPAVTGWAVRLAFGGVSHTADVYLDGKHVGHHYDAFTPFDIVVPRLKEGDHELVVEVDNSFGEHSALHMDNDYYTYGGITRPAEVQLVPSVYIDRLFALPVRRGQRWDLDVRVRLASWSRQAETRSVAVAVADGFLELGDVTVEAGGAAEVTGRVKNLDVEPWTPESPALYAVEALLSDGEDLTDDLLERVGFREVKVRGKKLLLNGEPVRLRGYNRHEDHPQFGCALPLEAMVTDLEILRDLGCNFVRTCHYPNDMRFLDLCDELGFCVWEESHARCVKFDHPKFREQIAGSTREMVDWHYNHPSILMWGCLNECDSVSAGGRKEHKRVLEMLRELDGSRPVTFASNKAQSDRCLDLVDIVSWNRYTGWYNGRPEQVEDDLKDLLKWLNSDASGGKNKPVIMSEFGGGAIPGYRRPHHAKWTEQYQAEVLDHQLGVYLHHPQVVGATIWQFCDCRVTFGHFNGRPRTMNNKGTVDEFRLPKASYEVVKRHMHEARRQWQARQRKKKSRKKRT